VQISFLLIFFISLFCVKDENRDIVSGCLVFEWTDEWYKNYEGGGPTVHDASSQRGWAFPGKVRELKWCLVTLFSHFLMGSGGMRNGLAFILQKCREETHQIPTRESPLHTNISLLNLFFSCCPDVLTERDTVKVLREKWSQKWKLNFAISMMHLWKKNLSGIHCVQKILSFHASKKKKKPIAWLPL